VGRRGAIRYKRSAALSALEIERVWILSRMPTIPSGAQCWEIEQGYLPEPSEVARAAANLPADAESEMSAGGRLRRIRTQDGRTVWKHTIKRGVGLVREESERSIEEREFDRWWPLTTGRRIEKTRYRVRADGLVWEIDRFRHLPLVMLEVELPSVSTQVSLPDWLTSLVEREVTSDARYRNAALAIKGMPQGDCGASSSAMS